MREAALEGRRNRHIEAAVQLLGLVRVGVDEDLPTKVMQRMKQLMARIELSDCFYKFFLP